MQYYSPSQLFPLNPGAQTHLNEPNVLRHFSLLAALQLCRPMEHSSTSSRIIFIIVALAVQVGKQES